MFQELGLAPYPHGYNSFATVAHIFMFISCIWYMGFLPGIIIFLLYMFNIIDACFTWLTRFLKLLRYMKNGQFEQNLSVQSSIIIIIIAQIIFIIISFFVTPYGSFYEMLTQNGFGTIWVIIIFGCIGFILRHKILLILKGNNNKYVKNISKKYDNDSNTKKNIIVDNGIHQKKKNIIITEEAENNNNNNNTSISSGVKSIDMDTIEKNNKQSILLAKFNGKWKNIKYIIKISNNSIIILELNEIIYINEIISYIHDYYILNGINYNINYYIEMHLLNTLELFLLIKKDGKDYIRGIFNKSY